MNCKSFHEIISAYVDDELSERETRRLLNHLEQCRDCTDELRNLTLQREQVTAVRACYDTPIPESDFARTVMTRIDRVTVPRADGLIRRFFESIVEELLLPIRKPAVALPLVLLLVTGTIAGFYLQSMPNNQQQLLSVYDLAAAQPASDRGNESRSPAAERVELHLFDHFADTSTQTFAAQPCLLEYAAYTCTSEVEDY